MKADVVIIGGGYYGCAAAIEIRTVRPDLDVVILEREVRPFKRASSTNQQLLHAGYMYSKFPQLARECINGAKEFDQTYSKAIHQDVLMYYGVHKDSEITAKDYEAFCRTENLALRRTETPPPGFLGPSLKAVYETSEKTFDNKKLHAMMANQLMARGIRLVTSFDASRLRQTADGFTIESTNGQSVQARAVFNATFADSNTLHTQSNLPKLPLDHAVFLHFLVKLPETYNKKGMVVVRGVYAALAPTANHSHASHIFASGQWRVVRTQRIDAPSEKIADMEIAERYARAIAEASEYMPVVRSAEYVGYTIGTRTNYLDPVTGVAESRAVVLRDYGGYKGYHCIFGGKVSCLPEITGPVCQIAKAI